MMGLGAFTLDPLLLLINSALTGFGVGLFA